VTAHCSSELGEIRGYPNRSLPDILARMKLWQLSLATWLTAGTLLLGLVVLERVKFGPAAGTCQHDGSGVSICPNPAQG
jgi:hypothetical protein